MRFNKLFCSVTSSPGQYPDWKGPNYFAPGTHLRNRRPCPSPPYPWAAGRYPRRDCGAHRGETDGRRSSNDPRANRSADCLINISGKGCGGDGRTLCRSSDRIIYCGRGLARLSAWDFRLHLEQEKFELALATSVRITVVFCFCCQFDLENTLKNY